MTELFKTRDTQSLKRLNIDASDGYELTYWTRQLGCSEQQLRSAIAAVGVRVQDVRAWLDKSTSSMPSGEAGD